MTLPTVLQLMTPSPTWCTRHDSIDAVGRMMAEQQCGAIPVVDDPLSRRPVGIITDHDIVRRVVARNLFPSECQVAQVMTPHVVELHADAGFHQCVQAMQEFHLHRIVIVDDRGRVIGIVGRSDLARAAARHPELGPEVANLLEELAANSHAPSR